VEPVADGRAHAGQQTGADVLDGQPGGHVRGVDWGERWALTAPRQHGQHDSTAVFMAQHQRTK
jgi:hypothetical protein